MDLEYDESTRAMLRRVDAIVQKYEDGQNPANAARYAARIGKLLDDASRKGGLCHEELSAARQMVRKLEYANPRRRSASR